MNINEGKYLGKINSGEYSRKELENLKKNASSRDGMENIIAACNEALSYGTSNNNPSTKEIGLHETIREIRRRGATSIKTGKEGNKTAIYFESKDGKHYRLLTRTKSAGTWQTTIDYAKQSSEPNAVLDYWIFVDLEFSPPKFYVVPAWWIMNDIWRNHQNYLSNNGGKRARNNESKHHAITLDRIKKWESRWESLGLSELPMK